jgi:uncharacterized oxidoreductase
MPDPPPPLGNCAVFVVFDSEVFAGFGHLSKEVSQLEEFVRSSPPIDPSKPITLPGDPELNTMHQRQSTGVPLDEGNWKALVDLAVELGVPVPEIN